MNGIHWVDGDLHLARAAAAAGIGFALSTASNNTIEEVAASGDGFRFFQLYPWGGPEIWGALLDRARDAGYDAAILTVDSLIAGNRERDRRNNFSHEVRYTPGVVLDGVLHPRWLVSTWFKRGAPRAENLAPFLPAGATAAQLADFTRTGRNPTFNWSDVARIREQWQGPLLIKGILRADDAAHAVDLGCDGVIVSNHGGRNFDGAVPTLVALEEIVASIGTRATVLVDGGFRRGTDIVKALALGADGVLLGRATLYGLACGGRAGVDMAIGFLRDEVVRTMEQLGAPDVSDLSRDYLVAANTPGTDSSRREI
jgi:(S)-mandelate dehydrogenase